MSLTEQLSQLAQASPIATWTEPSSGRELPLVTPPDEATCVRVVQFAAENDLALIPIGLGSKTALTSPADRVDFALSTRGVAGIEAYEPGDGTVTVRAGTTMSELRDAVAKGGHRLTPDVPLPDGATIGGVIAAGQSGFDRLRFGPLRNHVLGLRVLLGDGTIARTGGRLVKNVTGYDLQRLYTGSRGSLCLILEASLRLFPLPEDELAFSSTTQELSRAFESIGKLRALPLTWDTLTIQGQAGALRVFAALSGRSQMLDSHRASVEQALCDMNSTQVSSGAEARAAGEAARDDELASGWPSLRLLSRSSQIAEQSEHLLAALRELGGSQPTLCTHPEIATLDLWLTESDPARRCEELSELHEVAERNKLRIEWLGSHTELPDELLPKTLEAPAERLMAKLQSALDPAGVFARGRFYRGL